MKNHNLVNGSSAGLAALIQVDTTVSFLSERQQGINLVPLMPMETGGYVWKRVFLRRQNGRGE
jgi:hypothetical protein